MWAQSLQLKLRMLCGVEPYCRWRCAVLCRPTPPECLRESLWVVPIAPPLHRAGNCGAATYKAVCTRKYDLALTL